MQNTNVTPQSIIKHINNSWSYISKGVFQPKARPGLYGHSLDNAISRLARKMDASYHTVRSHIMRLMAQNIVSYVGDRLIASKEKIVGFMGMSRPALRVVKGQPATEATGIDYAAIDAAYAAKTFDDELDAAYADLSPHTLRAYGPELRAALVVA